MSGTRFFCLLLTLVTGPAAQATTLTEVTALAEAGAAQLAVRVLGEAQPDPAGDMAGWIEWERERIRILRERRAWPAVAERLATRPDGAPAAFERWAREQRARALLEQGRSAAARRELAALIWGTGPAQDGQLAGWRRLVIRSYEGEGRSEDAYAALVRYDQDYGTGAPAYRPSLDISSGPAGRLLRARVLIANGLAAEAAAVLEGAEGAEAEGLRLLARLRHGAAEPGPLLEAARALSRRDGLEPRQRRLAWGVAAEAAAAAGEGEARVAALERLLGGERAPLPAGLIDLDGADLWRAYTAYGERLGNRDQLLLGDDAAWFAAADAAAEPQPVRRRALLAVLATRAGRPGNRQRARRLLAVDLMEQPWGLETARALFLESSTVADPEAAPPALRRALIDRAIAGGDLVRASALQAGLPPPKGGVEPVMAYLRRAKIFILGGRPKEGAATLSALLRDHPDLTGQERDRTVQLLFDLQSLDAHEAALDLLGRLFEREGRLQVRRELLYWMADSRAAQGRHAEAGHLYLRSAMLPGPRTMDQWAQSARYQAAKALGEAGLLEDAEVLLERILAATEDPSRRAVLRREIQQLGLKGDGDD